MFTVNTKRRLGVVRPLQVNLYHHCNKYTASLHLYLELDNIANANDTVQCYIMLNLIQC